MAGGIPVELSIVLYLVSYVRNTLVILTRKELHPLPIRGLGYRWGVDFAGPLPKRAAVNTYGLVCIEHFTKWVELIPLPSKSSKDAAWALLDGVLSRYGAQGEVLTDQ